MVVVQDDSTIATSPSHKVHRLTNDCVVNLYVTFMFDDIIIGFIVYVTFQAAQQRSRHKCYVRNSRKPVVAFLCRKNPELIATLSGTHFHICHQSVNLFNACNLHDFDGRYFKTGFFGEIKKEMCCFSKPTSSVSMTTLTAVFLPATNVMRLIYTNEVETKTANAMVLPISGDFKGFVAMDKEYDQLALKLYQAYSTIVNRGSRGAGGNKKRKCVAEIQQYGSYLVSYAPSLDKVDWQGFSEKGDDKTTFMDLMHARYPPSQGFGFVVAKMAATTKSKEDGGRGKHPIVFDVSLRGDGKALLPTYHLHHGSKEEETEADWDHLITLINCKPVEILTGSHIIKLDASDVEKEVPMLNKLLAEWKAGDIGHAEMTRIRGNLENADLWIKPPVLDRRVCDLCAKEVTEWPYYSCMSCTDLDFCGKCFTLEAAMKFTGENAKTHSKQHMYHKMAKAGDRQAWKEAKTAVVCLWCGNYVAEKTPYSTCSQCPMVTCCQPCSGRPNTEHLTSLGHAAEHSMIAATSFSSS